MMVDAGEYPFGSTSPAPPPAAAPAFPPGPHSYATLTPLQPLPPLNAIPEEFGFVSSDGYNGNVSGSFTVMQANGPAAPPPPHPPPPPPPLHAPYSYRAPPHAGGYYDMPCEQQPQQCWDAYCQPQDYYPVTVKTEAHPHHYPTTTTPPSPAMHQPQLTPPAPPQPQPQSPPLAVVVKAEQAAGCHQVAVASQQEAEEINTKELAQRISAELKRYSIPQAIFAQRILCRSQGTLSDLLRNPKPWSKLKSGRETFRRMWKWLQEPEYQRMSSLRHAAAQIPQRAACKRKLDLHHHALRDPMRDPLREHHALPVPMHAERMDRLDRLSDRKQRLLFADLQRYF